MHCLSRVSGNMTWGIVMCRSYVTIIHFIWHEDRGDYLRLFKLPSIITTTDAAFVSDFEGVKQICTYLDVGLSHVASVVVPCLLHLLPVCWNLRHNFWIVKWRQLNSRATLNNVIVSALRGTCNGFSNYAH